MVRPQIGMLGLMAAVALVAINLSVMQSWEPVRGDGDIPHYLYATGVLPMASALIFVAMISTRELASRGRVAPFAVGFLAAGCPAIFTFVTAASLDVKGLRDVGHGVLILAAPFLLRLFERPPIQTQIVVECGLVAIVFSTPQLLFGLLGGWFVRRLGLRSDWSVRVAEPCRPRKPLESGRANHRSGCHGSYVRPVPHRPDMVNPLTDPP